MRRTLLTVSISIRLLPALMPEVSAQASGVNPDISIIPQVLICPTGVDNCTGGEADGDVNFQEVEIAFQGYLNPYVRADVFTSFEDGDFEVEEAYATFVRGLGPFQAKLGQYLVDWGSLNPLHPHAHSWIFRPLVEERFFGREGLGQLGVGTNLSIPAGERGEFVLSLDLLRGDVASEQLDTSRSTLPAEGVTCVGPGCDDGLCEPGDADCALVFYAPPTESLDERGPQRAYHFRTRYFNQFRESHSILFGVDALRGTLDPGLHRDVRWYGADFKYRWRPDKYRSLNLIGAYIESRADLAENSVLGTTCIGPDCAGTVCPPGGVCQEFEDLEQIKGAEVHTSGGYVVGDWQFAERWNAGAKYDWSEGLESHDEETRAELFLNFRLMEESTLFRLLLRRENGDHFDSADHSAALQVLFTLGPHKPHSF